MLIFDALNVTRLLELEVSNAERSANSNDYVSTNTNNQLIMDKLSPEPTVSWSIDPMDP